VGKEPEVNGAFDMGKVQILTDKQEAILAGLGREEWFTGRFYFTGGTALSEVYLQHRVSEDLDLFTEKEFETQKVLEITGTLAREKKFTINPRWSEPVMIYILKYADGEVLKVDFAKYPYARLEESQKKIVGITVDSLLDIAVNKLLSMTQRMEVKDFVDMYFLLKRFSFWDLVRGVEVKFKVEVDPFLFAVDVLGVESFDHMPKMLRPLSLDKLKKFYRDLSVKLGKRVVE